MAKLVYAFVAAFATLPWAVQAQFTTYPVSTANPSPLPQDNVTSYPEGFCYCDVTAFSCDSNCCCDQTCSSLEVERFSTCLPTRPLTPELTFCIAQDLVSTITLPSSGSLALFKRKASGDSLARSLFCIVDENNPSFGSFFQDPEPATAAVLETALNKLPPLPQTAPAEPADTSTYQVGQRIPIGRELSATITQNGYFSLPVDPYTGFCVDGGMPLGMGIDAPAASTAYGHVAIGVVPKAPAEDTAHRCIRVVAPADCVPGGALSVRPYTTTIYLAASPESPPALAPALQTAQHPDGATVTLTAAGELPEPLLDAAAGVCRNVPLGVEYTVLTREGSQLMRDPGGQIEDVRVDVIMGNATAVASDGRFVVQQAFSVKFRSLATAADAIPISGSPGYRTGAMLLYGVEAPDGSGIARRTTGLPLPAAAPLTGACIDPSRLSAPVRFGVDAAVSCGVPLTPAELRELCRGGGGVAGLGLSAAAGAAGLLPRFGGLVPGARIGSWGSADVVDLHEWIEIDQEVIDDSMAWDEETATCSRVPAGVRLEILVSAVGSSVDPQRRITFARSRVLYRQWRHPWAGVRADNATDAAFAFPMETIVRFVAQEQAREDAVRKLPPLQMSLPEDFFYPFTGSASTADGGG